MTRQVRTYGCISYTPGFVFFFSIDRFDLICWIIRLKFYSDEFLHFTYGFEFNLYTKDMKK